MKKTNFLKIRKSAISIAALIGMSVIILSFTSPNDVNYSSASGDKYRTFVKTSARCSKCKCSGYWGYKHQNGTYEGSCSNSDGWGHRCGHGPEKHGLRKW
ncbi:MAG: hypothetical protein ACI30R_06485 [Sodaliphilus sp.]